MEHGGHAAMAVHPQPSRPSISRITPDYDVDGQRNRAKRTALRKTFRTWGRGMTSFVLVFRW